MVVIKRYCHILVDYSCKNSVLFILRLLTFMVNVLIMAPASIKPMVVAAVAAAAMRVIE